MIENIFENLEIHKIIKLKQGKHLKTKWNRLNQIACKTYYQYLSNDSW